MKIDRKQTVTFQQIYDWYKKIYLDTAFQRKGGWDRGSGWPTENFPAFIHSVMADCYGNSITMLDLKKAHDSLLEGDTSLKMVDDIAYYNSCLNNGYEYLSIDGWNTTSCIFNFIENEFDIFIGGKDLKFKDLHPSIQNKFLSKTISLQIVKEASLEEVTKLFRLMNSSTALRAQERRQARFTDFARSIRMLGEKTSETFFNWVYCVKDDLDQRKHEETLAVLYQAKTKQYSKMKPSDLDNLYEDKSSLEEQEEILKTLEIMNEIAKETGPLSSKYRITRGDFIVLYCLIEHLNNLKYTIVNKKEFWNFYNSFITALKSWTESEPEESQRYKKWSTALHSGYAEKTIRLNISHLENNISQLEKQGILQQERKRNFSSKDKIAAFHKQGGKDPDGKQMSILDLQKGNVLHADHDYPFSKGGETTADNLVLMPKEKNLRKGDKIPERYINNQQLAFSVFD